MTDHPFVVTSDKSINIVKKEYHGIGYELFWNMKKFKDNTAQYILDTDTKDTYQSLLQRSIRAALKLKSKELGNDPIIAICAANHFNNIVPLISAMFLGYRVATFDGSLSITDTSYLIKQLVPEIMFIDQNFVPTMEAAIKQAGAKTELVVFEQSDRYPIFEQFLEKQDGEESFEPIKLDSKTTALILFSSGSTGLPKGICLSHLGLLAQTYSLKSCMNFSPNTILMYFSTLNWITAVIYTFLCTVSGAARVVCPISRLLEGVNKYKVTNIYITPYLSSLIAEEKPENVKTDSVISIYTAGTKLNSGLRPKLAGLFPRAFICQSYGITEFSGWTILFDQSEDERLLGNKKPDSVGKAFPGAFYKIVDPETEKILGPNEIGELRLKGDLSMNGYFRKDSGEAFDSEGWLKTGDLVYYDEEKCFYIIGRCKEVLKYRGFHIQPQMLEAIIESHPAIDKAVVIGITHEIDGDHPMAFVMLKKEALDVSPKSIELYVEERVQERQRLRAGVKIISKIPFTSTGKPKRKILKEMAEGGNL